MQTTKCECHKIAASTYRVLLRVPSREPQASRNLEAFRVTRPYNNSCLKARVSALSSGRVYLGLPVLCSGRGKKLGLEAPTAYSSMFGCFRLSFGLRSSRVLFFRYRRQALVLVCMDGLGLANVQVS